MRTNAGIDLDHRRSFDTASTGTGSYAASNYIALTENATAPGAGDTTLTAEITTQGLARAQATYSHTNGTTTSTLTKTLTMTAGGTTTFTPAKAGLFNAPAVGTLDTETAIGSPPALIAGDSVAITWTQTKS